MICLDYVIKEKWVLFVMVLVKVSEFRFGKMVLPRVDHTGHKRVQCVLIQRHGTEVQGITCRLLEFHSTQLYMNDVGK